MASLNRFAREMKLLTDKLGKELDGVHKDVAKEVLNEVIADTPVDTSEGVSNWQAAGGAPVTSSREALFLGAGGSTKSQSAAAANALGRIAIDVTDDDEIHITNTAEHIADINDGSIRNTTSTNLRGNKVGPGFAEKAAEQAVQETFEGIVAKRLGRGR